jgi:hypothetical protein
MNRKKKICSIEYWIAPISSHSDIRIDFNVDIVSIPISE